VSYNRAPYPHLLPPLLGTEIASSATGPSVFSQPPDSGALYSDSDGADLPALSTENGRLS
jgi:hypothetical protein